jgi:hypothetical protein
MKLKPPVIILMSMLAITLGVFSLRTYRLWRAAREAPTREARYQKARELFDKTLVNDDRVEFELMSEDRLVERLGNIRSDLAQVVEYIPEAELGALVAWESQPFLSAESYLADPDMLDKPIANLPVEIYTRDISPEEVKLVHEKVKQAILVFSQKNFEDYIAFRGGSDVLLTEEESEEVRRNLEHFRQNFQMKNPQRNPPSTLLEAKKSHWESLYEEAPYMDRVAFGGCFLAFYEATPDTFEAEKWRPQVSDVPCELTEKAQEYGSLSSGNRYRTLEYKVSPIDVMAREGKLKYFDFMINTGREGKLSFPVAFRFYYEPSCGRWLLARIHPFYNADIGEKGMESPGIRPIMN